MLSYFNLNNRSEKTRDITSRIPKGIEESMATASRLKKLAVELEESPEPLAPVFIDKASNLVIDASRLAKDASGLVRNEATAKGYEDLAEKVKSLSRKTLRVEDVARSKDASGLVRDASGLVRDASGLVRDASGLVRDASGTTKETHTERRLKKIVQAVEDLEKKAGDLEKKDATPRAVEEATSLVGDASKLVKDTSDVVLEKNASIPKGSPFDTMGLSPIRQVVMYMGVFIGVFFSAAVDQFRRGEPVTIELTIGKLIMSAFVALIVIPLVYGKLGLSPGRPFLVQFALFFQNGVFFNVILNTIA
jgi:hypothetical protein